MSPTAAAHQAQQMRNDKPKRDGDAGAVVFFLALGRQRELTEDELVAAAMKKGQAS